MDETRQTAEVRVHPSCPRLAGRLRLWGGGGAGGGDAGDGAGGGDGDRCGCANPKKKCCAYASSSKSTHAHWRRCRGDIRSRRAYARRRAPPPHAHARPCQAEQELLTSQLHDTSMRARELRARLDEKEAALDSLSEQHRHATQDLISPSRFPHVSTRKRSAGARCIALPLTCTLHAAARGDIESMLEAMGKMEQETGARAVCTSNPEAAALTALSAERLKGREAAVQQLARESKDKVEEALLERDNALAREAQSRRCAALSGCRQRCARADPRCGCSEIARLLERRREEAAASVAREQAQTAAVRSRLAEQLERRMQEMEQLASKVRARGALCPASVLTALSHCSAQS